MGGSTPLTTDPRLRRLVTLILPGGADDWLSQVLRWLRQAPARGAAGEGSPRTERLRQLAVAIAVHPQADLLREQVQAAFAHPSILRLLAETGIPIQTTILREVNWRVSQRFLPRAPKPDDIVDVLNRANLEVEDAEWLEELAPDEILLWQDLVVVRPDRLLEAAHVAGVRAAATGLAPELYRFRTTEAMSDSPFLRLGPAIARCREQLAAGEPLPDWAAPIQACRLELDRIEEEIEKRGVSTEAVFRIEALEALLARVGTLMLLGTRPSVRDGQRFAAALVRASSEQHGLRAVLHTAAKRLSRKIVEYTGETGEHYTVRDRAEWRTHFDKGLAAGFLTSFTAIGKYATAALPLAPVVAGLGYWVNYSFSFCMMQVNHWLLASKQPAMTAAALANTMADDDNHEEIELIAGITRSQTAVTLANALATMSLAILLDLGFRVVTGRHMLSTETASHSLHAINPVRSLTVVYAVTTGISLWLASLAAGWAANWSAYRQLPEGIARDPRVLGMIGRNRALRLSDFTRRNFGGIMGYIVLGMLLGFVPVLFDKFLGIALEVRHITLQAASVALTYAPLADAGMLTTRDVAWSFAGIAVTAVLNISVSFWLSLQTAMRARDLDKRQRSLLWRDLRAAFNANPGRFFFTRRAGGQADSRTGIETH